MVFEELSLPPPKNYFPRDTETVVVDAVQPMEEFYQIQNSKRPGLKISRVLEGALVALGCSGTRISRKKEPTSNIRCQNY